MKIIMATGHRPNKLSNEYNMDYKNYGPHTLWVYRELEEFVAYTKPDVMISGMAIGVDMIWATIALRMGIPLWAYIPFEGQESKWNKDTIAQYSKILAIADKVVIVSPRGFANWKFQKRNMKMVDDSTSGVGVYDGTAGGTHNTIQYARSVGKNIHIIDPKEYFRDLNL